MTPKKHSAFKGQQVAVRRPCEYLNFVALDILGDIPATFGINPWLSNNVF